MEEIIASGHTYEAVTVKEPTCNAAGVKRYTCQVCGAYYDEEIQSTGEHNYQLVEVTPATCCQRGVARWICTSCGQVKPDSGEVSTDLNPDNHVWDEGVVVKAATYEAEGQMLYTCTYKACGATKTETIPKLEKNYPKSIVLNLGQITLSRGKTQTLSASLSPNQIYYKSLTWTSDIPSVATVDANGLVKALKGGSCTITVKTQNNLTQTCMVTVPYKVTYSLAGGTNSTANPAEYTGSLTLKNPTRLGYLFQGWYKDSKFKTKVSQVSGCDCTVYAKWTMKKGINYNSAVLYCGGKVQLKLQLVKGKVT